jgi:endonuclease/exonuclease/phosphatase family metal-dependent hydrolase
VAPLAVASFNVWFDEFEYEARAMALIEMLQEKHVHIIGLQEVTPRFLRVFAAHPWIRKNFYLTDNGTGQTIQHYGTAIASRFPVDRACFATLPTNMNRDLLFVKCTINSIPLLFATTHLESMNCPQYRKVQLQIIARLFHVEVDNVSGHSGAAPHNVILCGDFNFDCQRHFDLKDTRPMEYLTIPESFPDFVDAWAALYPDQRGHRSIER